MDLILTNARIPKSRGATVEIGISGGRIVMIHEQINAPGERQNLGGCLVVPGFIEAHIHLDKSNLLDVCDCGHGGLSEAIEQVARAKRGFTEEDVYARAQIALERAILHGTTRMRTHVEVDPRIGLTSFHALVRLKQDYAWAIDLQLCVFPQEGLIDDPGCEEILIGALDAGAAVLGGVPYVDSNSHAHIACIFKLAERYDTDIDLHLDFSLDPSHFDLEEVCRLTDLIGWGGRVTIGHVSKLSAIPATEFNAIGKRLAASGVAVTVLPSTDLYLMGRNHDHNVPRGVTPAHRLLKLGVTCALSTNNVLNPFTPFGDCSLVRMANLYANIAQIGNTTDMGLCLDMITAQPAKLMRLDDYGIAVGKTADLIVLDCHNTSQVVAEIAPVLCGYKRGRQSFIRPKGQLLRPA